MQNTKQKNKQKMYTRHGKEEECVLVEGHAWLTSVPAEFNSVNSSHQMLQQILSIDGGGGGGTGI